MNIPQEAIEAAAQALSIHWKAPHTNEALGRQRALAEHALTAALPVLEQQIREQVAREIQSMPCVAYTMPNGRSVKVVRRDDAARIARGKDKP